MLEAAETSESKSSRKQRQREQRTDTDSLIYNGYVSFCKERKKKREGSWKTDQPFFHDSIGSLSVFFFVFSLIYRRQGEYWRRKKKENSISIFFFRRVSQNELVLKTNVTTRSSYLLPFHISFCSSGTRRSIISDAANLCIKKNNDQPLPFFPSFLLVRRGRFLAMSNVFRREALALKPSICSVSTHLAASFRVLASLFGLRNASVRLNKYKPSKTVIARGFDADQLISCYAFSFFFRVLSCSWIWQIIFRGRNYRNSCRYSRKRSLCLEGPLSYTQTFPPCPRTAYWFPKTFRKRFTVQFYPTRWESRRSAREMRWPSNLRLGIE